MNVKSSRAPGSAQREAILVAATAAFLRYGFKKTSMDDVARAAGVSRQGLYLYFDTKDLLFREALRHLVSHLSSNAHAVAEDGNLSLRDRLLGAFEAVHCSAFHNASREDALELLQTAQSAAGALLVQLERDLMGIAAALLAEAGGRGPLGGGPRHGCRTVRATPDDRQGHQGFRRHARRLRERMLTAIRIVMRDP